MQMSIRGVVFSGPGHRPLIEDLRLDPPGEGEVLVRIASSGKRRIFTSIN